MIAVTPLPPQPPAPQAAEPMGAPVLALAWQRAYRDLAAPPAESAERKVPEDIAGPDLPEASPEAMLLPEEPWPAPGMVARPPARFAAGEAAIAPVRPGAWALRAYGEAGSRFAPPGIPATGRAAGDAPVADPVRADADARAGAGFETLPPPAVSTVEPMPHGMVTHPFRRAASPSEPSMLGETAVLLPVSVFRPPDRIAHPDHPAPVVHQPPEVAMPALAGPAHIQPIATDTPAELATDVTARPARSEPPGICQLPTRPEHDDIDRKARGATADILSIAPAAAQDELSPPPTPAVEGAAPRPHAPVVEYGGPALRGMPAVAEAVPRSQAPAAIYGDPALPEAAMPAGVSARSDAPERADPASSAPGASALSPSVRLHAGTEMGPPPDRVVSVVTAEARPDPEPMAGMPQPPVAAETSAPQTTRHPVPPPAPPPPPGAQMAEAILTARDGQVQMRLSPDELGQLRLTLHHEGEVLRIHVLAERPDTLDLLRRHAPELVADLRAAGLGAASLSFGASDPGDRRSDRGGTGGAPDPTAPPDPSEPRRLLIAGATLDLRL